MEDVYNMREERGGIVDGNIRNLVRNRILSGQLQNTEANLPFYQHCMEQSFDPDSLLPKFHVMLDVITELLVHMLHSEMT
jgi:hypothetical protein